MRKKGLVLPGYACTSHIWEPIRTQMEALFDVAWVDWPRELTPAFDTLTAFADWLEPSVRSGGYDFVIGHSMGGLVALELAQRDPALRNNVLLVETFLLPPKPFFQNMFMKSLPAEDSQPLIDMLDRERAYYSPLLRQALQQYHSLPGASSDMKINALYGDRGNGRPDRVAKELGWPRELKRKIRVSIVKDACHFPMVENPGETLRILQGILG